MEQSSQLQLQRRNNCFQHLTITVSIIGASKIQPVPFSHMDLMSRLRKVTPVTSTILVVLRNL